MNRMIYCLLATIIMIAMYWHRGRGVHGEIHAFGLVTYLPDVAIKDEPRSPTGKRLEGYAVVREQTEMIPAKLQTRFGFNFVASHFAPDSIVSFRQVIAHPLVRTPDDMSWTRQEYDVTFFARKDGTVHGLVGYNLGDKSFLVPGEWIIEVWYEKQKLVSKSFLVVPAS